MYPVLKIMDMLNFLDTFSMGITIYIRSEVRIQKARKKKLVLRNGWMESNEPEQSAGQCPSWAWFEEKKLIALLIVVINASSVMLSTSLSFTAGGMGPHLFSFVSCM